MPPFKLWKQPQNAVPDVIVWMLSGNDRVAVCRIPSHELMYSSIAKARGKNCGKIQTIYLTVSELTNVIVDTGDINHFFPLPSLSPPPLPSSSSFSLLLLLPPPPSSSLLLLLLLPLPSPLL